MKGCVSVGKARRESAIRGESGMVSAELALTFPAVIMIVVALGLAGAASIAQVQVNSAARDACRILAAGADNAQANAAAHAVLSNSGHLSISTSSQDVHCVATRNLAGLLGFAGMQAHAEVVIPREDSWSNSPA